MPISLGTIGSIVSILGIGGWLYKRKLDTLDSRREREEYIRKKLQGRGWEESPVVFEIDDITIEERSGWRYRVKRWGLRPLEGSILLSLKSRYVFDDQILESRLIGVVEEETNTRVEHVDTITSAKVPMHLFRVHTVEFDEVMPAVQALVKILSAWMEVDDIEYSLVER